VGGAPLLFPANFATMFGPNEQTSGITMLATLSARAPVRDPDDVCVTD
jgi:hypothetical protein